MTRITRADRMCLKRLGKGSKRQRTYKLGATNGIANASILLKTMMAAMALAAYFWYVSIMYPITQSISRTVPAPKMAAPMFLRSRVSL